MYRYPRAFPLSTNERGHAGPWKMKETVRRDDVAG